MRAQGGAYRRRLRPRARPLAACGCQPFAAGPRECSLLALSCSGAGAVPVARLRPQLCPAERFPAACPGAYGAGASSASSACNPPTLAHPSAPSHAYHAHAPPPPGCLHRLWRRECSSRRQADPSPLAATLQRWHWPRRRCAASRCASVCAGLKQLLVPAPAAAAMPGSDAARLYLGVALIAAWAILRLLLPAQELLRAASPTALT